MVVVQVRREILICLVVLFAATAGFGASREVTRAESGMVASRSALASQVGVDMLAQGGNAIDAAVAVGFALAVTHPSAGNLAGGGFMVIRLADGTLITNDHREKAPSAAHKNMYLDDDGNIIKGLSTASHLAVGVPGTVAGLLDVLERYGSLSRREVLNPAIRLARRGFELNADLARQLNDRQKDFAPYASSMEVFGLKNGQPYRAGDLFKQTDLAKTLTRIRDAGLSGFYSGKTADLLVAEMESGGGIVSQEDLMSYASVWRQPIVSTYRGYTIVGMPPPSSGGVLIAQMLNMLEAYDLKTMGYGSAEAMHLMIEVERRTYADRAEHLGDSDYFPVAVKQLISKDYARSRFENFDPRRATRSADIGPGSWPAESPDTTHASTIDKYGNAVAYTTTLNLSYGSKIVAAGTGMLLNNEMDDFSSKENTPNAFGLLGREANAIQPGKRMLSSMSPTIVLKDGEPLLVTGSPGGSTIITTTLQVILNVIDHGMDLSDAVGRPRFHHQWQPDRIIYEKYGISPDTLEILKSRGHQGFFVLPWGRGIGDANSVMRVGDEITGMADPRSWGTAIGY